MSAAALRYVALLAATLLLAACVDDSVEIDGPGHPPCLDAGEDAATCDAGEP